jgi:hypothetical protein
MEVKKRALKMDLIIEHAYLLDYRFDAKQTMWLLLITLYI